MPMDQLDKYTQRVRDGWKQQMRKDIPYVGPVPGLLPHDVAKIAKDDNLRSAKKAKEEYYKAEEVLRLSKLIEELPNMQDDVKDRQTKKAMKRKLEEFFPVYEDATGKESKNKRKKLNKMATTEHERKQQKAWNQLFKDTSQTSKLQYCTKTTYNKRTGLIKTTKDTFNAMITINNKTTVHTRIHEDWVRAGFNIRFVEYVKLCGKQHASRNYWVPVPAGSRMDGGDPTAVEFLDTKIQFQQGKEKSCAIKSMASALYHFGFKSMANNLADKSDDLMNLPADMQMKQIHSFLDAYLHSNAYLQDIVLYTKPKSAQKVDIFNPPPRSIILFVPHSDDGGMAHALCAVNHPKHGKALMDSSDKFALPLEKESVDHCIGGGVKFDKVRYAVKVVFKNLNFIKNSSYDG